MQVQIPPDEIARRIADRRAADRDTGTRVFDAAAAVALSYAAAKSVPSFDKLAELSAQHLPPLHPPRTFRPRGPPPSPAPPTPTPWR